MMLGKKGGINFGNSGMNPDLQQHWITVTRADLSRDATALLPCAVGMSCWRGTPGDPKGVTAGCWNIIPCRPTSIRDLLAWSGMQNTQYPQNAKKKKKKTPSQKMRYSTGKTKRRRNNTWHMAMMFAHQQVAVGKLCSPFSGLQA